MTESAAVPARPAISPPSGLAQLKRWFNPSPSQLNLALQGGGAHGAFTWGVLDALLEDERVRFEGLSIGRRSTVDVKKYFT